MVSKSEKKTRADDVNEESTQANDKGTSAKKELKQAVIVVHGMGEQRPMDTIREFVNHVFKKDPSLKDPHFWNKPSSVSESFEQRRLTTNRPERTSGEQTKQRTDFYEYYWAHHTVNTKWEHFIGWFKTLLLCWPTRYNRHPDTLQPVWFILWGIIALALASLGVWWFGVNHIADHYTGAKQSFLLALVTLIEGAVLFLLNACKSFFTKYFGDVARYVRAEPANILIRQSIRKGGIDLIERIHNCGDYDRVILVGHSLGSIVAYDILNHLWARHNKFKYNRGNRQYTTPLSKHALSLIQQLQSLSKKCGKEDFEQKDYRSFQTDLFEELRNNDKSNNWLISDFVTLGSPLTYADILLFDDLDQFNKRKLDREYPTSPPMPEQDNWYYSVGTRRYLHHGAVFAPVKWTNIHMPHKTFIKGDIISGNVSTNFSYDNVNAGNSTITAPQCNSCTPIKEVELDYKEVKDGFTHTEYWKSSEISDDHLEKVREALNLY